MEKWCVVNPKGVKLPEPLADTKAEVIEAFCYLSEIHPDTFAADGYTTGKFQVTN